MRTHTSVITINENALRYNLKRIRQFALHSKILAMVKANAYGHGLISVAKTLADVDAFGVACFAEAIALRNAGINNRIIIMRGAFTTEELQIAQQLNIELVIHHPDQVKLLEQQLSNKLLYTPLKCWIKINTGMNRLGFAPEEIAEIYPRLQKITPSLYLLTHFASADSPENSSTKNQIEIFNNFTRGFIAEKSLANSAGILAWPESHADWIRPGIMLYGVSPFSDKAGKTHDLLPVMTWHSELIAVRLQRAGDKIGYCKTWTCPEDMLIGIVGVGYADGYPRHAKNGTPVLVNDLPVPLIGRVSMDMLAVDLRTQPQAKIGDVVTLWGEGLPIEDVARHTATSAYELLCNARLRNK